MAVILVVAVSADKLVDNRVPVAILRSLNQANDDGSFKYKYYIIYTFFKRYNYLTVSYIESFESADGIKVDAAGNQKQVGAKAEEVGTVQSGSYSYTAPDGTPIAVTWTADENGFRASGAHLPVAPPMPDHVVKMLDDLRAAGRL